MCDSKYGETELTHNTGSDVRRRSRRPLRLRQVMLAILLLAGGSGCDDNPAVRLRKLGGKIDINSNGGVIADLKNSRVTDQDLEFLKRLGVIQQLNLSRTKITDEGLWHLRGIETIEKLSLAGTAVTDEGLAHLKGLTRLRELSLSVTKITDAGLAHLSELTNLEELYLSQTRITDNGLLHLQGLTKLKSLYVGATRVTKRGTAKLRESLPHLMAFGSQHVDPIELKSAVEPESEQPPP